MLETFCDTLFHMVFARVPKLMMAPIAAIAMNATIIPYSIAVAAFVSQSSFQKVRIVPTPGNERQPAVSVATPAGVKESLGGQH